MYPIRGYCRKSYLILGWCVVLLMSMVIVAFSLTTSTQVHLRAGTADDSDDADSNDAEATNPNLSVLLMVLLLGIGASCGIAVASMASLTMTMELAQREPLHVRGTLQATFLLVRTAFQWVTTVAISFILQLTPDGGSGVRVSSRLSLSEIAGVMAGGAAVALLAALRWLHEDRLPAAADQRTQATQAATSSLRGRTAAFWTCCHRNVVWRIVAFLCLHMLLIGVDNPAAAQATLAWSHVTPQGALHCAIVHDLFMLVAVSGWRVYLVNYSWTRQTLVASLVSIAASVVLYVPTAVGAVRNAWFYALMSAVPGLPRGCMVFLALVAPTEIAELGLEGVTTGLVQSCQLLSITGARTLSVALVGALFAPVTAADVARDTREARHTVLTAALTLCAVNLLGSLAMIPLLPRLFVC